jgi:hypothetical protein
VLLPDGPFSSSVSREAFIATYIERCASAVSTNGRGCLRKFAAFVVGGRTPGERPIGFPTDDVIELFFAALQRDASSAARGRQSVARSGLAVASRAARAQACEHQPDLDVPGRDEVPFAASKPVSLW